MPLTPRVLCMADPEVHRRRVLKLAGVASLASLSGCASIAQRAESEAEQTKTQTPSPTARTTAVSESNETNTSTNTNTSADASAEVHPKTISEPRFDLPVESVPKSSKSRYPTLGTADTTLTLYGNWKCPYTQEFVRQQFGDLVETYVKPGDVSVRFRNVAYVDGEPYLGPDAPRASEAGLAVWNVDPESFWTYFSYVFANQPQERFDWATTENLVRFAEQSNVEGIDQIRQAIRTRAYAQSVELSAAEAADMDVTTVPRVVYEGNVTAPTVAPDSVQAQFERAANDGM